jgi:hypothetical protein
MSSVQAAETRENKLDFRKDIPDLPLMDHSRTSRCSRSSSWKSGDYDSRDEDEWEKVSGRMQMDSVDEIGMVFMDALQSSPSDASA